MTKRVWAILVVVFFIGFLAPELWAYFSGTATLSQSIWAWIGAFWPLALGVGSYAFGLLCGHLWWPQKIFERDIPRKVSIIDYPR